MSQWLSLGVRPEIRRAGVYWGCRLVLLHPAAIELNRARRGAKQNNNSIPAARLHECICVFVQISFDGLILPLSEYYQIFFLRIISFIHYDCVSIEKHVFFFLSGLLNVYKLVNWYFYYFANRWPDLPTTVWHYCCFFMYHVTTANFFFTAVRYFIFQANPPSEWPRSPWLLLNCFGQFGNTYSTTFHSLGKYFREQGRNCLVQK